MDRRSAAARLLLVVALAAGVVRTSAQSLPITLFDQYVESLRRAAGIPGVSAVLTRNRSIVWERGFGFQDVENGVRARSDTPYAIGGLTQLFTASLVLQCMERGHLDLDAPMQEFTTRISTANARVRHVLTHTSEGTPGERFKYDLTRIGALTEVSNACSGFGFRKVVVWEIFDRFAMFDTVPGADVMNTSVVPTATFEPATRQHFSRALARLAVPYKLNRKGDPVRSELTQPTFDTSTGVISTVLDLATFDRALADDKLLLRETVNLAWTNPRSPVGAPLPHGLGWFVQNYQGEKIVWQFGALDDGYSSLYLRIPGRDLTLIMLANSDGLSTPFQLQNGDVTASPFVKVFLKLFIP